MSALKARFIPMRRRDGGLLDHALSTRSRFGPKFCKRRARCPLAPQPRWLCHAFIVCGSSREDGKYNRGFRTDTGQFAAGKKRDGSLVFSADCAENECGA